MIFYAFYDSQYYNNIKSFGGVNMYFVKKIYYDADQKKFY